MQLPTLFELLTIRTALIAEGRAGEHNPQKDIDVINTELILADLQTVDKRLPRIEKEAKANPKLKPLVSLLQEVKQILDSGKPLFQQNEEWRMKNEEFIRDLQLLTMKPVIYVFNVDEATLVNENLKKELLEMIAPSKGIFVCAKLEHELQGLDEVDRQELLLSYGVASSGLDQLIHAAYDTLGLQSYLTAGEKEVRAWTIKKDSTAPQAAGVIHGDFERGFIAAQIVDYNDLISAGSEAAAKAAGKIRTEGKTYVMQPNDVVEFRFNVSK
jgi:ribosome-binding ATPase